MKQLLVLISGLVLVAACAVPPTNRESAPVNSSSRGAEPAVAPLTEAEAIAKEKAVWDAIKAKNYDAFAAMLAPDYLEVGSSGLYDKAGTVAALKELEFTDATFADWKLLPLGKSAALLMYNLTLKGKYKGQDIPPGPYRVGLAWGVRDGKWQAVYYQETRGAAPEPHPAGHTPTPTPAASAATASPKANEIGAIADPIAREKAVYEALKRKDYDAFAAMLDDAQVEAWADGFHTRAETIEGVKMFDATKATLSDFKSLKISDDVELVTYVTDISGPKPERARASTIWIKRGENWKAIYHQGTPIENPPASPAPSKP